MPGYGCVMGGKILLGILFYLMLHTDFIECKEIRVRRRVDKLSLVDGISLKGSQVLEESFSSAKRRFKRQSDDDDNDWNWESWSDWYDSWSSWSDWVRATPWTSWDSWSSWDYTTASNYGYDGLGTGGIIGIVAGCVVLSCCLGCCKAFLCGKKEENNTTTNGVPTAVDVNTADLGPVQYSSTVTRADGRTMRTHQVYLGGQPLNTDQTPEAGTTWQPPGPAAYPPAGYPPPDISLPPSAPPSAPMSGDMPPPPSYDQAVENPENTPGASHERLDAITASRDNVNEQSNNP